MPKLNDLQSILLSTAAQRDTGSLYPVPEAVADTGARIAKAIATLIKAGFAKERAASDGDTICRADGDLRFGVFIMPAGASAIGVGEGPGGAVADAAVPVADLQPAAPTPAARVTKAWAVIALLQRDHGATLAELIAATGWLPHTTRAALTGLRKKGHAIKRGKRDNTTCYRILTAAVAA